MNHFTLSRRAACAVLLGLGSLAVVAGCSPKRVAGVDAGYTTLEGRPDANARLLAWFDTPDTVLIYQDNDPEGPDLPSADSRVDVLIGRELVYRNAPGVVHTLLLDGTAASGFQFFRRADNGGLQAITDYTISSETKWLPLGWEMYSISDPHPSAYSPTTYVARGLLEGRVTTTSPVSNDAVASGPAPRATINLRYIPAPRSPAPQDSSIAWTTTPGAAGYWLDIYQFKTSASFHELATAGTPAPVMSGSVTHVTVAYFPDDGVSSQIVYKLCARVPGSLLVSQLLPNRSYLARVTAVDALGRVIAWTRSRTQDEDGYFDDWMLGKGTGSYALFPTGALVVPPPRHVS